MARQTASAPRPGAGLAWAGFLVAAATFSVFGAQDAAAQTMNANSASFNAGFGRIPGDENRPVNVQLTDGAGNSTLVNGLLTSNSAGSVFSEVRNAVGGAQGGGVSMGGAGAGDSFSGAGGGSSSASAIGNSLNVIVQGDNNTVIVNANQTNNGAVTATTTTSGK